MIQRETAPPGAVQAIWFGGPLPGLNDMLAAARKSRGRHSAYSKLKADWTAGVSMAPILRKCMRFARARFLFVWEEEHQRRDPDNLAAGGTKLILDGLVKAGVLDNDGWKQVAGIAHEFIKRPGSGVLVRITAVE